jgi:hypothetical protein
MISSSFDNTDRALKQSYDSGYFGAVGLLLLPELLLVSHSENWLTEDGSNRISLIDRNTGDRRGQIEMALGHPPHACPDFPVPFVFADAASGSAVPESRSGVRLLAEPGVPRAGPRE